MKYTSKVQPFVSVSQKEANAIHMDQKLDNLIANKNIDSHLKRRLYEDGIARLRNYRDEMSEVIEPPLLVSKRVSKYPQRSDEIL